MEPSSWKSCWLSSPNYQTAAECLQPHGGENKPTGFRLQLRFVLCTSVRAAAAAEASLLCCGWVPVWWKEDSAVNRAELGSSPHKHYCNLFIEMILLVYITFNFISDVLTVHNYSYWNKYSYVLYIIFWSFGVFVLQQIFPEFWLDPCWSLRSSQGLHLYIFCIISTHTSCVSAKILINCWI